jgi:hypothetical protein
MNITIAALTQKVLRNIKIAPETTKIAVET